MTPIVKHNGWDLVLISASLLSLLSAHLLDKEVLPAVLPQSPARTGKTGGLRLVDTLLRVQGPSQQQH